jgi:ABC-2 type transport system ATP-binding protein
VTADPDVAGREVSLELIGLSRRFGSVVALDGLTFSVPPGEVFGFLGPNGAGKTTTMRAIFGVLALEAGQVEHFSFATRRLSEVFRDVTGEDA